MKIQTLPEVQSDSDRIDLVREFLEVRSACLVGASDGKTNSWSFNARMTRAVLNAKLDRLQLVGRSRGDIEGVPVVDSVLDTSGQPGDLCVLVVRASDVIATIREAQSVGWDHFLIISELGEQQRADLAALIPDSIRVWGPNCVGYTVSGSELTFMATDEKYVTDGNRSNLALLSQSGGALGTMAPLVEQTGLNVSHLLSVGEEADLGIEDVLDYFAEAGVTDGAVVFVEEARRPDAFLRAVGRCTAKGLPVVVVKVGKSAVAQQAAQDHTGALAGDWDEFAAAVRHSGGVVADSFRDAANIAALLVNNNGRRPGPNTVVFTTSGGSGALAADLIDESELRLSPLSESAPALQALNSRNSTLNPFDSATGGGTPKILKEYLQAIATDPSVDSLLFLTSGNIYGEFICDQLTSGLLSKPIVFVSAQVEPGLQKQLNDNAVLVVDDVGDAVRWLSTSSASTPIPAADNAIFDDSQDDSTGEEWLTYTEGTTLLARAGISRPSTTWLSRGDELAASPPLTYPVVVKGGNLRGHKALYGGVRTGVHDRDQLLEVIGEMSTLFPELVVEAHAPSGAEVLVTAKAGPLGGMLVIGFGGKHADALGNQVVLSRRSTATEIVTAVRATPLYTYLGSTIGDARAGAQLIADLAVQLSAVLDSDSLDSVELNPVMVTPDAAYACDVKGRRREGAVPAGSAALV
ncbi:acetate--CoA ligase family protein [Rhodococcus sp. IEGM 1307]|uniref:acetate--CoA ligase family protein n=1 Tax=Rhodococcus sp. IEGM 1307 TaxID=3047091 RepID=UPI0024B76192|nr:acetate--CoA ligase family protein [Rhodococcus sp. IEGM 1307]MDI9979411.1 acetate--CoA ligase family protein [Rhodococcus sp. IEGM 1307]